MTRRDDQATITVRLTGRIEREGEWYVAKCIEWPGVLSQALERDALVRDFVRGSQEYLAACEQLGDPVLRRELAKVVSGELPDVIPEWVGMEARLVEVSSKPDWGPHRAGSAPRLEHEVKLDLSMRRAG